MTLSRAFIGLVYLLRTLRRTDLAVSRDERAGDRTITYSQDGYKNGHRPCSLGSETDTPYLDSTLVYLLIQKIVSASCLTMQTSAALAAILMATSVYGHGYLVEPKSRTSLGVDVGLRPRPQDHL